MGPADSFSPFYTEKRTIPANTHHSVSTMCSKILLFFHILMYIDIICVIILIKNAIIIGF